MKYNDKHSRDPEDICNKFSNFFQSVYEPSSLALDNWSPPIGNDVLIDNLHFDFEQIRNTLKALDPSKGACWS
ncbi:jg14430 [Pararge aegeria aegeria]|uniref:Jg14430 protein n=1 Tax=Pararge aegeria aegeria TaxID=348720 RepID=A0A8S4RX88_9NEOP|nr:jg14430 [Pararge aegeria aegeria]